MVKDRTIELKHRGVVFLEHVKGTVLFDYRYDNDHPEVHQRKRSVPENIHGRTQQIMRRYEFENLIPNH